MQGSVRHRDTAAAAVAVPIHSPADSSTSAAAPRAPPGRLLRRLFPRLHRSSSSSLPAPRPTSASAGGAGAAPPPPPPSFAPRQQRVLPRRRRPLALLVAPALLLLVVLLVVVLATAAAVRRAMTAYADRQAGHALFSDAGVGPVQLLLMPLAALRDVLLGGGGSSHGGGGGGGAAVTLGQRTPTQVPGLSVREPLGTLSAEERLARYGDMDFVYTYINHSDATAAYVAQVIRLCFESYSAARAAAFFAPPDVNIAGAHERLPDDSRDGQQRLRGARAAGGNANATCPAVLRTAVTNVDVWRVVEGYRAAQESVRRDLGELRYSVRSVERHVGWHRGRVLLVTPGHVPAWADAGREFMGRAGAGRLVTVHQDAVLPYGARLTRNSHVIEAQLWRLRGLTPLHVYLNDDYYINRDVAITDFVNELGGPIVREEDAYVDVGVRARGGGAGPAASWRDGVLHTWLVLLYYTRVWAEAALPARLRGLWYARRTQRTDRGDLAAASYAVPPPAPDDAVWVALTQTPEALPDAIYDPDSARQAEVARRAWEEQQQQPPAGEGNTPAGTPEPLRHVLRLRGGGGGAMHLVSHAPYVYCTNLFRHYIAPRFEVELSRSALLHPTRAAGDLLMPFVHHRLALERPWAGSPRYLPHLFQHAVREADLAREREAREAAAAAGKPTPPPGPDVDVHRPPPPRTEVALDNTDGCAPALRLRGRAATGALFTKLPARAAEFAAAFAEIDAAAPLFFNLNDGGCTAPGCAAALRGELERRYPTPARAEVGLPAGSAEAAEYARVMGLPAVVVVEHAEGVCGAVRSLGLGLRGHAGAVAAVVTGRGGLREARAEAGVGPVNGMAVAACQFGPRVRVVAAAGAEVAAAVRAAGVAAGAGALVVDARSREGLRGAAAVRRALGALGQTLALEDLRRVPLEGGGEALVVSREDPHVHWVTAPSEAELLLTFPLPGAYEDMDAEVKWVFS